MKKFILFLVLIQGLCGETFTKVNTDHQSLFLSNTALNKLKKQAKSDPVLQHYVSDVMKQANKFLKNPPMEYRIPDGLRLLAVSRDAIDRIHTLAFAWRWSKRDIYADKAIKDMIAIANFKDWNPRHFLDTAEMCNAMGVGYDWLYPYMSVETRVKVRDAIIKHGLTPDPRGQVRRINNWNMVCNSGLIVAALAIVDTHPQYAEKVIPRAVKYMPNALKYYAPSGAWMEGPAYWHYATRYVAYGLDAMDSILGKNYDLDKSSGLKESGLFPIHTAGATGEFLCFADSGFQDINRLNRRKSRGTMACMFWLAKKYNNPSISDAEHEILKHRSATVHHLIWYVPPTKNSNKRSLDYHFKGAVPVVTMRSAWNDPNANWLGVKAGFNQVPHGHLDLGGFEFESQGVRWALDLGSDEYNLPGYWDKRVGGKRWDYWRLNSFSHNVPIIDGKGQLEDGTAEIVDFVSRKEMASTTIDLTKAYSDRAQKMVRKIALTNDRQDLVITDEFIFSDKKRHEVIWAMMTDATIEKCDGKIVTLTKNNQRVTIKATCNASGSFTVEEIPEVEKPLKPRPNFKRLNYKMTTTKKDITVKITIKRVEK